MKKRVKDEGKSTLLYIIAGIVLAFGINYGMGLVMATSYPIVAVESNSMSPVFSRGDILLVQGVPAHNLKERDIIVFSVPGKPVPIVHRVVGRNPDGTLQTKGDANTGQHPWEKSIDSSQVKGKEVLILPLLGWVKIVLTELVMPNILSIIVAAALLAFIYLLTNKKELFKR